MLPAAPARIHLLPAKEAPLVIVLRRKPSRLFHVLSLNTQTGHYEQGTWFTGKLYPLRCDTSFDGKWLVYLALGAKGVPWNGISLAPRLTCVAEGSNAGTWFGGGYWVTAKDLSLNHWKIEQGSVPFRTEPLAARFGGECLSVLYPRWERDGWVRCGENWGLDKPEADAARLTIPHAGDDGWELRPSRQHPTLHASYAGYLEHGYTFRFRVRERPDLLDDAVDSATYDALGQLVVSRRGVISVYTCPAARALKLRFQIDLEPLAPKNSPKDSLARNDGNAFP